MSLKAQNINETEYYYYGNNVTIEIIYNNLAARNIMRINPLVRETDASKLYFLMDKLIL